MPHRNSLFIAFIWSMHNQTKIENYHLKGHSTWVFHCWPKCWEKPKIYFYPIWTFCVFSFSRYYTSKLTLFLLLQCYHFVSFCGKIIDIWKHSLRLHKKIVSNWKPWKNNPNCFNAGLKSRRKLKFGEGCFQICEKILKENRGKKFSTSMRV